jgi:adenylate kinase family enzyme
MTGPGRRILITGAAGSGKTTLGRALAERLGVAHFDTDDFMWESSDLPFTSRRDPVARDTMFRQATAGIPRWVLSGTLIRWGDAFMPLFQLVVFLYLPAKLRLERLERRERERYGAKIEPGGPLYQSHQEFMRLARGYESGEAPVNNLANDRNWLSRVPCPVIEIDGAPALAESLATILCA